MPLNPDNFKTIMEFLSHGANWFCSSAISHFTHTHRKKPISMTTISHQELYFAQDYARVFRVSHTHFNNSNYYQYPMRALHLSSRHLIVIKGSIGHIISNTLCFFIVHQRYLRRSIPRLCGGGNFSDNYPSRRQVRRH